MLIHYEDGRHFPVLVTNKLWEFSRQSMYCMYVTLLYAVFKYFFDMERIGAADFYGTGLT